MDAYEKYGEYLEDLHDQLDRYNIRRTRLIIFSLFLAIALLVGIVLWLTGRIIPIVTLLMGALIAAAAVRLGYEWYRHHQAMTALEHEVSRLPYRQLQSKQKRKPSESAPEQEIDYTIGDDGELIQIQRRSSGQNE